MTQVRTDLGNTKESARRERFEPTASNLATNVQQAIANAATAPTNSTARLPASGTPVAILTTDTEVGINTSAAAVICNLPSVAAWAAANPNGLPLRIFDYTGNANVNNITFVLNGSDVFLQGISPVVSTSNGGVALRPVLGSSNKWNIVALG
jgi:hypothetical protein